MNMQNNSGYKYTSSDFVKNTPVTWCKGCLFNTVYNSITAMLADTGSDPSMVNVLSGIGCSSRIALYLKTYSMHTLHGRAIPVAVGAHLAKPDRKVMVIAGDGDLFSIGIGHFVHAAQKNIDITVICLNNSMFAMTKNQSSPTSCLGHCGSMTPQGTMSAPLDLMEFSILSGATFAARTTVLDSEHLLKIITGAYLHKGFSFVEIVTPCLTFDRTWRERVNKEPIIDICTLSDFTPDNNNPYGILQKIEELKKSGKIVTGIFRSVQQKTYDDHLGLSVNKINPINIDSLCDSFRV
jgi:2-oxoglutarate ferredoxin oxidoreductase subunit beta